ncbi:MAG: hypothetical protein JSS02_07915 [Planctomycetes bacterium]|nr:hypothetical protein [Planctomycetota bacterium]
MSTLTLKEFSREGNGSAPPRFAYEALGGPAAHQVEQDVRRVLLSEPTLRFSSLVIRRIADGVCLQGILEADDEAPDVSSVARRVRGVRCVLNHLVITPHPLKSLPPKG